MRTSQVNTLHVCCTHRVMSKSTPAGAFSEIHELKTRLFADVSFGVPNARESVLLTQQYLALYPVAAPLIIVLKTSLRQSHLNMVHTGGLSSYAVTLLVVSYLKLRAYEENSSPCITPNSLSSSESLLSNELERLSVSDACSSDGSTRFSSSTIFNPYDVGYEHTCATCPFQFVGHKKATHAHKLCRNNRHRNCTQSFHVIW